MTPTESALRFADGLIQAPEAVLSTETNADLLGVIQIGIDALTELLPHAGVGWVLIELEMMKDRIAKRDERKAF